MKWSIDNYCITFTGTIHQEFPKELIGELETLLGKARQDNQQLLVDLTQSPSVNSRFYGGWLAVLKNYYDNDFERMQKEKPVTLIMQEQSSAYNTLVTLKLDCIFQYQFV